MSILRRPRAPLPRPYIALVNPIAGNAYAMQLVEEQKERIHLSLEVGRGARESVSWRYMIRTRVTQAVHLAGVKIRGTSPRGVLPKGNLRITADHMPILEGQLPLFAEFKEPSLMRWTDQENNLFKACEIDGENQADAKRFLGYFLPNCTNIEAWVDLASAPRKKIYPVELELIFNVYNAGPEGARKLKPLAGNLVK